MKYAAPIVALAFFLVVLVLVIDLYCVRARCWKKDVKPVDDDPLTGPDLVVVDPLPPNGGTLVPPEDENVVWLEDVGGVTRYQASDYATGR